MWLRWEVGIGLSDTAALRCGAYFLRAPGLAERVIAVLDLDFITRYLLDRNSSVEVSTLP